MHLNGEDPADRATFDPCLELAEAGIEAKLKTYECRELALVNRFFQRRDPVELMRKRLLDEQVRAGACGGQGDRNVKCRRITYEDGQRLSCERRVEIPLDRKRAEMGVWQRRVSGAIQPDVLPAEGLEVAQVTPAYGTETRDQNFVGGRFTHGSIVHDERYTRFTSTSRIDDVGPA
jgi:hypothetical protein